MKTRLLVLSSFGGIFFFSAVQLLKAQSAINQLGGQPLQDQFNQLRNTAQQPSGTAGQQNSTASSGSTGVGLSPAQQQAAAQAMGMAGNVIGNMLAQPAMPTAISYQQQQQIAARQLNNSGIYLLKNGDSAGAIREFQRALARNPADKTIQNNLKLAQQNLAMAQAGNAKAAQTSSDLAKMLGLPPAPGSGTGADSENSSYTTIGPGRSPGGSETATPGASLLNLDGGASTLDSAAGAQPVNTAIAAPTPTAETPALAPPQISSQADSILGVAPASAGASDSSAAPTTGDGAPAETAASTPPAPSDGIANQNLSAGTKVFGQPVAQPTFSDLNADSSSAGSGFDIQGKILGSGGGAADSGVVDLRGKQGIVDPADLKGRSPQGNIVYAGPPPSQTTPTHKDSSGFYRTAMNYNGPLKISTTPHGTIDPRLACHQETIDALNAAAASYNPGESPAGYQVLHFFTLSKSGTDATLYGQTDSDGNLKNIVLAFQGTTSGGYDWSYKNDPNAAGLISQAYISSVSIAKLVQQAFPGVSITLAGHSLGGGEAALASMATGLPAITFNAAGVNPSDYGFSAAAAPSLITNYRVKTIMPVKGQPVPVSEVLTLGQTIATPINMIDPSFTPGALGNQVDVMTDPLTYSANTLGHSMPAVESAMNNYFAHNPCQ